MKRVLVIGCPGAGKTTFAKKLAEITQLPLIHLDVYYNDKKLGYENDKIAWRKKVFELMKPGKWIMDGNYSSSFPERFEKADTIFFFDFPRRLRLRGILMRRIEYHNQRKKRDDMPGDWREKITWEFFWYVWSFEKYKPKITSVLNKETRKKVIIFKNRRDAQNYLDSLKPA